MFFDQPSQVYFPQGDKDVKEVTQADITAVNKMYKTIFDEINLIGANTGFLPQIIIVDHVDGKDLECKDEFDTYCAGEIGCSPSPHLTPSNQLYQPKKETVPLAPTEKGRSFFHFCG